MRSELIERIYKLDQHIECKAEKCYVEEIEVENH
jgi:hypothetical protein